MRNQFFILFLIIVHSLGAQKYPRNFGEISDAEMKLTRYENDPDAGAVVLFDIGKSRFINNHKEYDIRFTRTKRIKILDKSALDQAEVSIPFYVDGHGRSETVKSIEASTYNMENDRMVRIPLDESDVFEERINEKWRRKKFVFPDVQEGSVLEVRYVVESPFLFNLPDWNFQYRIPAIFSQYQVRLIPFYEYVFYLQGAKKFDVQKSRTSEEKRIWGTITDNKGIKTGDGVEFRETIHTYAMEEVPAFKDESFISSVNDYIIKLNFQLSKVHSPYGGTNEIMTTWPKLNKELLDHPKFGKYIKRSKRFARRAIKNEIEIEGKNEEQKIKTLINYVKNNYNWNGNNSKFASKPAKDFISQKTGNTAEINLFLMALFNVADIEAYPVILSTRGNGRIYSNYPFEHHFNSVIILAGDEQSVLADATNVYLPFYNPPIRCFNEKGLIVDKKEDNWVLLKNNSPSSAQRQITIRPNPETLKATTNITSLFSDYEAESFKEQHQNDTTSIKEFFQSKGISEINQIKTLNYNNPEKNYFVFVEGNIDLESIGDKIVISPFMNLPMGENKLKQKERSYPVDLVYPRDERFTITLFVPEGFETEYIPEEIKISDDLVDIQIDVQENDGGMISINGRYALKKAVYGPDNYSKLKTHFDKIVKHFNNDVVLKKAI